MINLILSLAVSAGSTALAAAGPGGEDVSRNGATAGLSLGGGAAYIASPRLVPDRNVGGMGSADLFFGVFLSRDAALLLKLNAVDLKPFDNRLSSGYCAVVGPAFQLWSDFDFNLVEGVGYGILKQTPKASAGQRENGRGLALMSGINYVPFDLGRHGLGISFDIAPIFLPRYFTLVYQAGISWQYY